MIQLVQDPVTTLSLPDVLATVSLAAGIISIVLGSLAIWLSLYLYHRSNELLVQVIRALSEIAASTKSTENTTSQVTTRVIDVLAAQVKSSYTRAEQDAKLRAVEKIERVLPGASMEQRKIVASEIARSVEEVFADIRSTVAPAAADYDWGPFIRRVDGIETTNRFLSVKWLRETQFAGQPSFQEALSIAIANGILGTYHRENPKAPDHPTLCCRLNRGLGAVRSALAA